MPMKKNVPISKMLRSAALASDFKHRHGHETATESLDVHSKLKTSKTFPGSEPVCRVKGLESKLLKGGLYRGLYRGVL